MICFMRRSTQESVEVTIACRRVYLRLSAGEMDYVGWLHQDVPRRTLVPMETAQQEVMPR